MKDWKLIKQVKDLEGKTIKRSSNRWHDYLLLEFANDEIAILEASEDLGEVGLVQDLKYVSTNDKLHLGLLTLEEVKKFRIEEAKIKHQKVKEYELREYNRIKEKYGI